MLSMLLLHISTLLGVSLLSILAWPRLMQLTFDTSLYKWLVVITLCSSWMFAVAASLLSALPPTPTACMAAIFICAGLYGLTKFCVYTFLTERLHIISTQGPRHKNPMYVLSSCLLAPFVGIVVLLMVYRVDNIRENSCHIGIQKDAAIILVSYDTFFGLFQIATFASILARYMRNSDRGPDELQTELLRKALKRALLGSFVAFILSFFNILTLVLEEDLHSELCFFLCIIDVVGNACVVTFLVQPASASRTSKVGVSGRPLCKAGSVVNVAPTSQEEAFEHELQTVAEMLKQMQAQGQIRQQDPTTSSASVNTIHSANYTSSSERANDSSRLLDIM